MVYDLPTGLSRLRAASSGAHTANVTPARLESRSETTVQAWIIADKKLANFKRFTHTLKTREAAAPSRKCTPGALAFRGEVVND